MTDSTRASAERRLTRIEPDERLVVLARTLQAQGPTFEASRAGSTAAWTRFGPSCLGQALYRHRSVFHGTSEAPAWSHLELTYFRGIAPVDAIRDLVSRRRPEEAHLLRAEILLTTPSAFVMPQGWRGSVDRPERQASLEYIHVRPAYLDAYRGIMRRYIGPAASRLVAMGRVGTFRAMETAVVLHHEEALNVDWNQIHLCEVEADGFRGFGEAFDAALREIAPDEGFAGVFAGLDAMRTIPRWTFNDALVEADDAVGPSGSGMPSFD